MATGLTFGVMAPQIIAYESQVERWHELEELGFDSIWFPDLIANPNLATGRWFEAYTLMAAAAVQTNRVRLGALVTSITFRHPVLFGKEALTIDHISNGRLDLGIGSAGAPLDIQMTGLGEWSRGERTARFQEFVRALDTLLRNDVSSIEGKYYNARDVSMTPGPVQKPRPPLTLAAHGPVTMKFAARYADAWNQVPGGSAIVGEEKASSEQCLASVRDRNRQMDEYCAAIGRDPRSLRRSIMGAGGVTPENPWASVEAFRDFVGRYAEAGTDEFVFYYPSRAEKAGGAFERIAREVMPGLQRP